jgi:hypothetical protein
LNNTYAILVVPLLAGIIIPVLITQTVEAKSNSIFSAIGDARDRGIDDGATAYRNGQPNSPSCPSSSTAYCLIYNGAFHEGWSDAKKVAP